MDVDTLKKSRKLEVEILNRYINNMKDSIQKIVSLDNSIIRELENSVSPEKSEKIPKKIDVSEEVTRGLKNNIKKGTNKK